MPNVLGSLVIAVEDSPSSRASNALVLLIALAIVLGLFLVGVVLTLALRRSRQTIARRDNPETPVDPWREAGRRAQPAEPDDQPNDQE